MFLTQLGKDIKKLCKSVAPEHEIGVGEFIDLYFGAALNLEIPWLASVDGAMDLLVVVRQVCESKKVSNLTDYLHITIPVFVQDEMLLKSICKASDPRQMAAFFHSLLRLCHHGTPFVKMLLNGNKKALEQLNLAVENEGLNSVVDAAVPKLHSRKPL